MSARACVCVLGGGGGGVTHILSYKSGRGGCILLEKRVGERGIFSAGKANVRGGGGGVAGKNSG